MRTYIQTIPAVHLAAFARQYRVGAIVGVPDDSGVATQYRVTSFKTEIASADMLGPRVSMTIILEPLPLAPTFNS